MLEETRLTEKSDLVKVILKATFKNCRKNQLISIRLWSGRVIIAQYYLSKDGNFDVVLRQDEPVTRKVFQAHLLKIMEEKISFTMKLEVNGVLWPLRWKIKES